jgi:hypothetical protein
MGVRFIREPSETPNVVNQDDFRLFRYAVGGYNGYIKGRGTEFGYVVNGTVFKITSGVGILHGVDFEVDTNGWELDVGNSPTKRYFSIYVEVNLATNIIDIKSVYDTAGFPTVSAGDDLTALSTGTARMLLYQLTAQNGVISDISRKISPIKYYQEIDSQKLNRTGHAPRKVLTTSPSGEITTTTAAANQVVLGDGTGRSITTSVTSGSSSLVTSGAVAARLEELGFKTGTVTVQNSSYYSSSEIMQQGRVIIGKITFKWPSKTVPRVPSSGSSGSETITIGTLNTVEAVSGKRLICTHSESQSAGQQTTARYTCNYYINSRTLTCEVSWSGGYNAVTFNGGSITAVLAYCPVQNRYYFGTLT